MKQLLPSGPATAVLDVPVSGGSGLLKKADLTAETAAMAEMLSSGRTRASGPFTIIAVKNV
jgi:hypothetical protein